MCVCVCVQYIHLNLSFLLKLPTQIFHPSSTLAIQLFFSEDGGEKIPESSDTSQINHVVSTLSTEIRCKERKNSTPLGHCKRKCLDVYLCLVSLSLSLKARGGPSVRCVLTGEGVEGGVGGLDQGVVLTLWCGACHAPLTPDASWLPWCLQPQTR